MRSAECRGLFLSFAAMMGEDTAERNRWVAELQISVMKTEGDASDHLIQNPCNNDMYIENMLKGQLIGFKGDSTREQDS